MHQTSRGGERGADGTERAGLELVGGGRLVRWWPLRELRSLLRVHKLELVRLASLHVGD